MSADTTARNRAKRKVASKLRLGTPRKEASRAGVITSLGTARIHADVLALYFGWLEGNGIGQDQQDHKVIIEIYLEECAEFYKQSTLNQHRNVLTKQFGVAGIRSFRSLVNTSLKTRSYSASEVQVIIQHQSPKNSLATRIAFATGLRAHELATLRPLYLDQKSSHRKWREDRFLGRTDYVLYVVTGKGGLKREVAIPTDLARELELCRIPAREVWDRGIKYVQIYDIGYGKALSQSFCAASKKTLGVSRGFHGLRHAYAKKRLNALLDIGVGADECLLIISNEMGHFRPDITLCYFR